jgi:ribosomal-protein-alanine N-acetyltransferase
MPDRLPYIVQPMTLADVAQVMEIERVAFPTPWSPRAYRYEITANESSTMLVVRLLGHPAAGLARIVQRVRVAPPDPLLGYAGFWLLVDDAHICTIAVHPRWRGQGLGDLLLLSLLDRAVERGAHRATLEVRVSNRVAQGLYRKFGFHVVSRRKRYYADNDEDAYIMATPAFETPAFQGNLRRCREQLHARLQTRGHREPHSAKLPGR